MTAKSGLQGRKQGQTLLAQNGDIPTNATESVSARQAAETSRGLPLHFDHAQIPVQQGWCQNPRADLPQSRKGLPSVCASRRADSAANEEPRFPNVPLASRFLFAFLTQTFRLAHETVRRG